MKHTCLGEPPCMACHEELKEKAVSNSAFSGLLSARDVELIEGLIRVQLDHAERCDRIRNKKMAAKQKAWDMERVELLHRILNLGR